MLNKYIAILVVIALLIAGFFLVPKEKVVTAEWSSYTNESLGIRFDYRLKPEKYILVEQDESELRHPDALEFVSIFNDKDYADLMATSSTTPREAPPSISVMVFSNPHNYSPQAWVEQEQRMSNVGFLRGSVSNIEFGGVQAVRYTIDGLYTSDMIVAESKGRIYVVSGSYLDENSSIRKDFLEMISHFQLY